MNKKVARYQSIYTYSVTVFPLCTGVVKIGYFANAFPFVHFLISAEVHSHRRHRHLWHCYLIISEGISVLHVLVCLHPNRTQKSFNDFSSYYTQTRYYCLISEIEKQKASKRWIN